MLEHTSMYFNVSPLCDEGETFTDFYTRLGPCEIQEPVWAKMSSALTAGVTKKRKKSDTKPQAQINKCQNEKRRREQENIYIEELAELISASFADMSSISVKPDKCAILQETVNQIRSIKQREIATQSSDPVQQGEVSSSERRPPILSNEIYGPLLLEALEGFLFVVNGEGKVEHVTDNVSTYIKFTREEVHGKCIYNFIHHGDHARFSATLLPMSIGWASEPTNKSRSFSCRLLIKPDDQDESMEEKQQRVSQYELMYISSTPLRQITEEDASDGGPCLLCVASRITHRDKVASSAAIEQFTTKLDIHWKIIGVDSSGISFQYSQFLNKDLVGKELEDICYQQDLPKLQQHLKETITEGQSTSGLYRLRIGHDKFVQVQTKSKLFKSHSSTDSEFVMATHSIISDNDCTGPSDPGGGSSVGGPLMTSVVNGTRNGAPVSSGSDSSTTSSSNLMNANASMFSTFTLDHHDQLQFGLDFPSSTWDLNTLDSPNWTEQRPDSRQSVTPVSTPTPRPPSAPVYSPATTIAQSPLAQFAQPSPTVPNPSTPYSSTYVFSPMTEPSFSMETDPQQQQHQQQQQQQQQQQKPDTKVNVLDDMSDSARLRTLLTKPPNNDNGDSENRNNNTILKTLLNQTDEDENRGDNRGSPRTHPATRNSLPGTSELPKPSAAGGMLLQLLNEKSDDDDVETRAGLKKGSELLHVLMKDDEKVPNKADTLLQSLGFNNNSAPPNGDPGRAKKRSSDDGDDNPLKRSSDGSHVTSSGSTGSKLCEKNKMLARLLAKTPSNHQPIPPIPASVISATPQEKLPRIDANLNKNHLRMQPNVLNMMNSGRNSSRMQGRPTNTNYLNIMLASESNVQQRNPSRQYNHVDSTYASPATSSTDTAPSPMWPGMHATSSDPLLSSILDQVIDIVPDAVMTNQNDIQTLLDAMSPQNNANNYTQNDAITEKMAINIIQKSLMQCETAVKSPSSPTITMPGSSPAYTTNTMSQPNHGYQPPPNYTHMGTMNRPALRPGTPQYNLTNQQLLQRKQQMQQQEKRRLLERQSRQQVVIPSNAAADMNPSLDNIESLLNNTVAPNVSLQRSSSVPESQLSPNYQLSQQNARINNQQPYSPHSQMSSPIGQQAGNYQQGGSSLSPRPPFNQQLSPRQTYPQTSSQNANWQPGRLSVQQQQNPMLNAQLTGNYVIGPNGRGFPVQRGTPQQQQSQQQQQQPRAIGSPGSAAGTRQSPFPADSFPPPASPNSGYSQSQYLRLQRNNSAPSATTQLPGGLGSPRPFARDHPTHSYPSIPPNPHHPMMYQQESSPYCYDQTGLQLPYNGADRGTRAPPHLQAGVPGGNGPASDYVRQELRAVVGARTGQQIPTGNTTRPQTQQQQQQQQQQLLNQNVNSTDLEALGLSFETSEYYGGGPTR